MILDRQFQDVDLLPILPVVSAGSMMATKPDHDAVSPAPSLLLVDGQEAEHTICLDLDLHRHAHSSQTMKDVTDVMSEEATITPDHLAVTIDEDIPPPHRPVLHPDENPLTLHLQKPITKEADEGRDTPLHPHVHAHHLP